MSSRSIVRVAAGLALVALAAAAGCSGTDNRSGAPSEDPLTSQETPERGGRLVYAIEADPNGLNPAMNAFDASGVMLANALYDPAVAFDREGKAQPYLLSGFEASPDFKTWKLRLRDGITFQQGGKLDADALKNFLDALRHSAILEAGSRIIADTTVTGPLEVTVTMATPFASYPVSLTGQGGFVVSPKQLADPEGHSHPDGTGPFQLEKWEQNKRFLLVRNPNYWRPNLPYLDGVDFEIIASGEARVQALRQGTVDATHVTNLSEVKELDKIVAAQENDGTPPAQRIHTERDEGSTEAMFVMFNCAQEPFDDLSARLAVAHATDVETLARTNGWDPSNILHGPWPKNSPWYSPTNFPSFDLAKAKQYAKAYRDRHKKPIRFTLQGSIEAGLLQQMIEMWKQAGIEARYEMYDIKTLVRLAVFGKYQAIHFRYFAAADPDLNWVFWSDETLTPDGFSTNLARLRDPQMTAAMNDGRHTDETAARQRAYATVQERFAQQVPYLWLMKTDWVVATRSQVRDAHNVTLPAESSTAPSTMAAMPMLTGTHRLSETWIKPV